MTRDPERWLEDVLRHAGEAVTPSAPELARAFQGVEQRLRAAPRESGEGSATTGRADAVRRAPWPRLLPQANTLGERMRLLTWGSAVATVGFVLGMQFARPSTLSDVPVPIEAAARPAPSPSALTPAVAPAVSLAVAAGPDALEGASRAATPAEVAPLGGAAHQSPVEPAARSPGRQGPEQQRLARNARAPSPLGFDEVLARLVRAERAQRVARPELALALLDEIDARADALTLRDERLMTRVLAACALGDAAAAGQAARALRGAHDSTIYASRLEETCAASDP